MFNRIRPCAFACSLASYVPLVLGQSTAYGQCGGVGWAGSTTCISGWTCVYSNPYYSQCLPSSTTITSTTGSSSTSKTASTTTTTTTSISSSSTGGGSTSTSSSNLYAPTAPPSNLTGKLPALGWNAWNAYGCEINSTKIENAANQFVSLGLKAAGYQYVNIDDCWAETERDATTGQIVPDPTKFPDGISGVANFVHGLGLKLGIYGDSGTATCSGYPGSLYNEVIDATTFANWGVDYLKYDDCNIPSNWSDVYTTGDWYDSNSAIRYRRMTAALAEQSNPIQFSLCIWGNAEVWTWGARVGHSWRMTGDISATWSSITSIIADNVDYLSYITFGGHNDMDMMEIGNGDLTIEEQRSHFAAWCFLKSPILLGTDLSLLNSSQISIITNAELLAFHQDSTVAAPAMPFTAYSGAPTTTPPEYYSGTSSQGTHVFIMNTGSSAATKQFTLSNVPGLLSTGTYKIHDMWAGEDLSGTYLGSSSFDISVATHDTVAYLITAA